MGVKLGHSHCLNVSRLRVFENMVLRIYRDKKDEVTGEWRKLHNEELDDLYCSSIFVRAIKIEKNEMGGACSAYGAEEWRIQGFGGGNLKTLKTQA